VINWIIEDFNSDNGWGRLGEELKKQGMDYEIINSNEYPIKMNIDRFCGKKNVFIQSSFQFAEELRGKFNPGVILTPDNYKCTKYYKYFGDYLFNNEYIIMTVKETENKIDFLERIIGEKETGRIFIRPDSGLKPFSAMVFINRDPYFRDDWSYVKNNIGEDELLIISSPKTLFSEWRFVVIDGKVVTGSLYKLDYNVEFEVATVEKNKELFEFAQKMADIYQPDIAFTLDLAIDDARDIKLLEINSFSCAGLYGCDMEKIINSISTMVDRRF
jgi:hypothetical protein